MPAWLTVLLLLFSGFILLLIELFIIPGFGLVGISSLILLFVASYIAFKSLSLLTGIVVSVGSFILVLVFIRFFSIKLSGSMVLKEKEETEKGFSPSGDYSGLLGKEGEASTNLRPAGIALIEGKKVSVVTEGVFITKGAKIKVVKVEGNKIFVKGV